MSGDNSAIDPVELAAELANLIADPEARRHAGAQGRKTVQENRGAVARLLTLLDPLVPTGQAN